MTPLSLTLLQTVKVTETATREKQSNMSILMLVDCNKTNRDWAAYTKDSLLTVLKTRKSKIKAPADSASDESYPSGSQTASIFLLLSHGGRGVRDLSCISFTRALILSIKALLSWPNHPPPPQIPSPWRLWIRGGHKHSDHSNKLATLTVLVRALQRNNPHIQRDIYKKRFNIRDWLIQLQKLRSSITRHLQSGGPGKPVVQYASRPKSLRTRKTLV